MSYFDLDGKIHMVNVTKKGETFRTARAHGKVSVGSETLLKLQNGEIKKGDVLSVAKIAGIMAAKKTSELIPLCHPLNITFADLTFTIVSETSSIHIESNIEMVGKTGAEMEALTAVTASALTIYDMCKSIDKYITISDIYLVEKTGGKSGHFIREK